MTDDLKDLLLTSPKSEVISLMMGIINDSVKENQSAHKKFLKKEFKLFDEVILRYFFLSQVIRKGRVDDKFFGRALIVEHYLRAIFNNLYTLKFLFNSGLHVQFQVLARNTIEFMNNLIALSGDDNYFDQFCTNPKTEDTPILAPKPIHTEKSMKKVLRELNSNDFDSFWQIFNEMKNFMYKDLSQSSHGHILRICIHSFGNEIENEEVLTHNFCGVKLPLPVNVAILKQCLNYFQFSYMIIWKQVQKNDLFEKNSLLYELAGSYSNKFEILKSDSDH